MRRIALRVAAVVVLAAVMAAGAAVLYLRSSLPRTDGTLALAGLEHPVTVTRDRWGIPTITAASEHDAAFALGFVHAQDRLFQMDMMRRFGAGRLSEVLGARTLGIDRFSRTLGLYRAAEAQLAHLSPALRQALDAYAAGVNAFLATRAAALPPEYYVLGAAPEPWTPADSLVWSKIMDLELTGNFHGQLLRARLLTRMSEADLGVIFPPYPADAPVTLRDLRASLERMPLDRLLAALPPEVGPQQASNDWVVDGAHAQSGKPLLANDPHLDLGAPGVWYLARIKTPSLDVAGATAPGTPFVIIGHTDTVAWGFTTTGSEVEDMFVEQPVPGDPTRYVTPTGAAPFAAREEKIAVKDAAPVTITVRATRHGPVMSDLAGFRLGEDVLALAAPWLAADDTTPDAIWGLSRARDWNDFHNALRGWVAPQLNIVYADTGGTIAFMAPSRVPIRAAGAGWLPVPGWTGEHDWTGAIPFDALPQAVDPASGRIVTANNKIVPDDYPYFLTREWEMPYRVERITALLAAEPKETPDQSAAIQTDDLSLGAKSLLPTLLATRAVSPEAQAAVALLKTWDLRMDRDQAAPLVYTAWLRELNHALLIDKLGPYADSYGRLMPTVLGSILVDHRDWCGTGGDCGAVLSSSLEIALRQLRARYGADMAQWRWGVPHRAAFASALWSEVPVVGPWFDASVAADGAEDTVNAGDMNITDPVDPFLDRHGPGLRMIVDLAAPNAARFVVAPGQSGNPLSPHWGDLAPLWRDGQSVEIGADASGGTLTLAPK